MAYSIECQDVRNLLLLRARRPHLLRPRRHRGRRADTTTIVVAITTIIIMITTTPIYFPFFY
jgi:hypothetical protein